MGVIKAQWWDKNGVLQIGFFEWPFEMHPDPFASTTTDPEDTHTCLTMPPEDIEDDAPYDDAQDHDPCVDCNKDGKGNTPGWYTPFTGPAIRCDRCDGAGWV